MTATLFSTTSAARRVGSALLIVVSAGALCAGAAAHDISSLP
ncbi:MAG: hypothetical protein NTV22_00430 [bacterium]|nr:hypothetical protein [bacterium]